MNAKACQFDERPLIAEDEFGHFVAAQKRVYERVVQELILGEKRSDWIWYIFPRFIGLERGYLADRFALHSLNQAQRYVIHPVLGEHLMQCSELVLDVPRRGISEILGQPDGARFHSSMTLFSLAAPENPVFASALSRFFEGQRDVETIDILWLAHQHAWDLQL